MEVQKWSIGSIVVTAIYETLIVPEVLEVVVPDLVPEALAEIDWLKESYLTPDGRAFGFVQAFLVQVGDLAILIDCCIGNDKNLDDILPVWSRLQNDFLGSLEREGFTPEMIDVVVCTHLHPDHIGWNTRKVDGSWVPTFPNARYLFGREEYDATLAMLAGGGEAPPMLAETLLPVVDAGLVDFVETDHRLCQGVRLVPTPGHTMGHVSVLIESCGNVAMITGDWLHHPAQIARPRWTCQYDADQDLARATRKDILKSLADGPTLVIGTHFSSPSGGFVVSDGDTYRFTP